MRCINKNIRFYLDRNKAVSTVYVPINKYSWMTTKRILLILIREKNERFTCYDRTNNLLSVDWINLIALLCSLRSYDHPSD